MSQSIYHLIQYKIFRTLKPTVNTVKIIIAMVNQNIRFDHSSLDSTKFFTISFISTTAGSLGKRVMTGRTGLSLKKFRSLRSTEKL